MLISSLQDYAVDCFKTSLFWIFIIIYAIKCRKSIQCNENDGFKLLRHLIGSKREPDFHSALNSCAFFAGPVASVNLLRKLK